MGSKHSNNIKSNRPESGGANKDERFEKSGLLDRKKEEVASHKADEKREPHHPEDKPDEDLPGAS